MRVSVLGPVRVELDDDDVVVVPMGKPLALLAMLALAQGQPVSSERLVLGLWGEDAPLSSAKTLQVHVSTLRTRLNGTGGSVSWTGSGYQLVLDGGEIDLVEFEERVRRGLVAASEGKPEVASRLLRDGLGVWTGDALSNVMDHPFAGPESTRLALRRSAAMQARIDADLLLGLGPTLVDELAVMLEANPYDERATAQLMTSLYRAGLPAAALDACQSLRRALSDDLGLAPGPEIVELERQVLMHDDRLLAKSLSGARRHNLPLALSSFVGRETELGAVCDLVRGSRLTTLTGAGGAGKTRLAIAAAFSLLSEPFEGLWLLELANLSSPELVVYEVAATVGAASKDGLEGIADYIADRSLLVILDNCEHLIDAVAPAAEFLLRRCANLRILATSRESLAVDGEQVYRVPPLALTTGDHVDLGSVLSSDAALLFADRAKLQRPDFALDDSNASTVARICRRLDGLPLAIELAVARLRTMSLENLAGRLDDRFRVLTGPSRRALPRQQTLRALVDWSYDLLRLEEQLMLDRLAVFTGGFTLEAAEAMVGAYDRLDALELVTALLDKSLIEPSGDGPGRFRLLETIREYAAERLAERGAGIATAARLAHAEHFLMLAEAGATQLDGGDHQAEWLERLEADHENLRAAVQTFLEQPGLIGRGLQLTNQVHRYWDIRGHNFEAAQLTAELLEHPDAPRGTEDYCRSLVHLAYYNFNLGASEIAEGLVHRATRAAEALGDAELLAMAATAESLVDSRAGRGKQAAERLEAVDCSELPDWLHSQIRNGLAHAALVDGGDLARVRAHLEAAALINERLGDAFRTAMSLCNLASIDIAEGHLDAATKRLEHAQVHAASIKNDWSMTVIKSNLANIALRSSDRLTAHIRYREALRFCTPRSEINTTMGCILGLAASSSDEPADVLGAAMLHGFLEVAADRGQTVYDPSEQLIRERDRIRLVDALGMGEFQCALDRGRHLSMHEAMELARTVR